MYCLLVCTLKVYGTVGDICNTPINNNAQMLSLDFHITFCPFISLCDQSFAFLSLGMVCLVKLNHYNILQYTIE